MKILRFLGASLATIAFLLLLPFAAFFTTLDARLFSRSFLAAQLERADLVDFVADLGFAQLPAEARGLEPALRAALDEHRSALAAQLNNMLLDAQAFATGRTETLALAFDLEPFRRSAARNVRQQFRDSPPEALRAELGQLPEAERPAAIERFAAQAAGAIESLTPPASFTEETLPPDLRTDLLEFRRFATLLTDRALPTLLVAAGLAALIGALGSLRWLGIALLLGGAVLGLMFFGAGSLGTPFLISLMAALPAPVQAWGAEFGARLWEPLRTLALATGGLGVAALTLSFLRPRHAAPVPGTPPAAPATGGSSARRVLLVLAAGLIIGVVLALGPGDALARYQAHRQATLAEAASDRGDIRAALAAWQAAASARPEDSELARRYIREQERWLIALQRESAPLSPGQRFIYFNDPERRAVRALLTEPLASGHQAFIEANEELVRANLRDRYLAALDLADAGDADAARRQFDDLRPFGEAVPDFAEWGPRLERHVGLGLMDAALQAATQGRLPLAREILSRLAEHPDVPASERQAAQLRIDLAALERQLDDALVAAERGELGVALSALDQAGAALPDLQRHPAAATVFAGLSEEERDEAIARPLTAAWVSVQRAAGTRLARRLAGALEAGDVAAADAALREHATALRTAIPATAADFLAPTRLDEFLELIDRLQLQSGAGQLVASRRAHLQPTEEVSTFLAAAFAQRAREFAGAGRPGLALYFVELATEAGLWVEAPELPRTLQLFDLAEPRIRTPLYLLPPQFEALPPGPLGATPDLAPIAAAVTGAVRDVLQHDNLRWLELVEGAPPADAVAPVTLQFLIAGVSEERSSYEQPWVWRFNNGTTVPYSAVHHQRNHAIRVSLLPCHQGQPTGSTVWHANLRYGALAMQGQHRHQDWYPPEATPRFLPLPQVVDTLATDLRHKVLFQAHVWTKRLAEALQRQAIAPQPGDVSDGSDAADRSWAQYRFLSAGGVPPADRAEREALVRAAAGLPPLQPAPPSPARRAFKSGLEFENSLGMRFVALAPVDAALAVWETRVRDYQEFVTATGHVSSQSAYAITPRGWTLQAGIAWNNPGFAQSPDHPVVAISRADALAFCAWLTARERELGLIGPGERYTLPADDLWSIATETSQGGHVWGATWPPPPGAGNFAGYEVADGQWPWASGALTGYDDAYARTAPVGSFSANPIGLHDLAGNVAEMLSDAPDEQGRFIARGGAFNNNTPASLSITDRARWIGPATAVGFRVALVWDRAVGSENQRE